MSARSNSEASSNASSPPSSVHMPGNNQVINNNNNAPKYGTLVPNRVFVGGIPSNTTEPELCQLFSKYGNVKATKIIADRAGVSKGYGFVTFETEEEAKRLQSDADNIVLRERRLNIAPAVKKQPFSRVFESATSPPPATPSLYYHNGMPYTFHNGMAYFPQTPNQGAAAVPTPDLPAVFQGSGFGPQSNPQSYGPAIMYPCGANPAAMFLSPQPYNPYPHMPVPSQGPPPLMYTGGPNPSATQATNTTAENTQSVQMTAGPPTPYYLPPAMTQTPEIYYNMPPAPSQSCYGPVVALASHDGVMHYCDVPVEQSSNNITPEDTYALPTPERPLSNDVLPPPVGNIDNKTSEASITHSAHKGFENCETPIVSLLSLQDDDGTLKNKKICTVGRQPKTVNSGTNRQLQTGYVCNGVSYHSTRGKATHPDGYRLLNSVGRGSIRGRGAKYIPNPIAPHDNNNNSHNYGDKIDNGHYRTDSSIRGMKITRGGRGRGSAVFNRGGRRGSVPTNFPPPVTTPCSLSYSSYSNSNNINPKPPRNNFGGPLPYNPITKSSSFQMQQQLFHQRSFPNHFYPHYTPLHQQPPPPPPPPLPPLQPRRYGNGKKPTNGSSNTHMNTSRKLKTVDGMDSGAAGDGPVPNLMQVALTPPTSPGTNSKSSGTATATQDLCAHVQAMSL
ncbi:uncharacterized protein LOC142318705 isoform X2 [Lycorma delicatula]|uniref:uncharacterized protein LOC142318705 isoform X2 n=1 Tax=Lycorma delicatula TaxID=130591 RepID=UPI003F51A192